jgi:UDP-N-acetylmuramate--alanine ligase
VDEIYDKVAVVITVTSESGEEGDIEILKNAIGNVDYIIPASYDCKAAADKLLSIASEGEGDYDLNLLSSNFVFTEGEMEQKGVRTLGASQEQVLNGLETALKTDADLVLCLGEAAFKFDPAIKDFCKNQ